MFTRTVNRSRFYFPLVLSVALFVVYAFFRSHALELHGWGDVRYSVFGKELRWLLFVAVGLLILFVVRLFDTVAFDFLMSRRRNVVAPLLLREILSIGLYVFLFGAAISTIFHYSITGLLTTTTVLAAVIGLALQDTLGNLFAGIALLMEGSFEVGDVLHSGDYIGTVEGINWRAVRIRAFNNQIIVLPHSVMAKERLEVFPRNNLNARVLQVSIDWHIPPAIAIPILVQAASHVDGVARDQACFARVGSYAESGVVYEIKYFTYDYSRRDTIDAEIRRAVWYSMHRNKISVPFPIRSFQQYTPPKSELTVPLTELLARLEAVDVLSPLDDDAHGALAAAAKVHVYSKGETILRHGAAGDSMFVIHAGEVSIRVAEADATNGWLELARLGPGSVFGEMALLTGEARTADVVALTDVTAIEIGKESLQPILQNHPERAAAISAKVTERRDSALPRRGQREEEQSVLSKIRAYFGL